MWVSHLFTTAINKPPVIVIPSFDLLGNAFTVDILEQDKKDLNLFWRNLPQSISVIVGPAHVNAHLEFLKAKVHPVRGCIVSCN